MIRKNEKMGQGDGKGESTGAGEGGERLKD